MEYLRLFLFTLAVVLLPTCRVNRQTGQVKNPLPQTKSKLHSHYVPGQDSAAMARKAVADSAYFAKKRTVPKPKPQPFALPIPERDTVLRERKPRHDEQIARLAPDLAREQKLKGMLRLLTREYFRVAYERDSLEAELAFEQAMEETVINYCRCPKDSTYRFEDANGFYSVTLAGLQMYHRSVSKNKVRVDTAYTTVSFRPEPPPIEPPLILPGTVEYRLPWWWWVVLLFGLVAGVLIGRRVRQWET